MLELFAHPALKRVDMLRTAQEVLHQIVRRDGAAGLENRAAVPHRRRACKQVGAIELLEEIFRNNFVPEVSVIGRRITTEVAERSKQVSSGGARKWRMPSQRAFLNLVGIDSLRITFVSAIGNGRIGVLLGGP